MSTISVFYTKCLHFYTKCLRVFFIHTWRRRASQPHSSNMWQHWHCRGHNWVCGHVRIFTRCISWLLSLIIWPWFISVAEFTLLWIFTDHQEEKWNKAQTQQSKKRENKCFKCQIERLINDIWYSVCANAHEREWQWCLCVRDHRRFYVLFKLHVHSPFICRLSEYLSIIIKS